MAGQGALGAPGWAGKGSTPRPVGLFPAVPTGVVVHVLAKHKGAVEGSDWNWLCQEVVSTPTTPRGVP